MSSVKKMPNSRYLTEDALFEIFLHLPFNSVCKFRCVSKSLLSLFTNPSFIDKLFNIFVMTSCGGSAPWTIVNRHHFDFLDEDFDSDIHKLSFLSTSSTQLHNKLISSQGGVSFDFVFDILYSRGGFSFDSVIEEEEVDIIPLASSNGLVLCSSTEYYPRDYFICNPFTRQFVLLPPQNSEVMVGLHGFVYESSTGTYKVIHIPYCDLSRNLNLQIFSSDTSEWSIHNVTCSQDVRMASNDNVFHIVNHSRIWYWIDGRGDTMIAYNDNHNNAGGGGECRLFDLPEGRNRVNSEQRCLGESKGLLCYGQIEKELPVSTVSVWVFQDDCYRKGSTWQLMYKDIQIGNYLYVPPPRRILAYGFLAFSPGDPNVVILECSQYRDETMAYNIETGKYEVLCSARHRPEVYYFKPDARSRIVVTPRPTVIPIIPN